MCGTVVVVVDAGPLPHFASSAAHTLQGIYGGLAAASRAGTASTLPNMGRTEGPCGRIPGTEHVRVFILNKCSTQLQELQESIIWALAYPREHGLAVHYHWHLRTRDSCRARREEEPCRFSHQAEEEVHREAAQEVTEDFISYIAIYHGYIASRHNEFDPIRYLLP